MAGTIPTLESLVRSTASFLDAAQDSSPAEAKEICVEAYREIGRVLNPDSVGKAIGAAWRRKESKIPLINAETSDIAAFLRCRYGVPDTDDRETYCRWMGILYMMHSQLHTCERLLTSAGLPRNDVADPSRNAQFVPRPGKTPKERAQHLPDLVDLVRETTPQMCARLSVTPPPFIRSDVESRIHQIGVNLHVLHDNGFKGLLHAAEIPAIAPDPDWQDTIVMEGKTIRLPPRKTLYLTTAAVQEFANQKDLPATIPVRAIQNLLQRFDSHLLLWRPRWWQKKKS